MVYEQLETLMGAYYHEDFEGIWPTLELFLRDATTDQLRQLVTELDHFLSSVPPAETPKATWALGSCLWLGEEPVAYVDWLHEVRRRVAATTQGAKAG